MLNTWVAGSIVPGVSISPLITGSVRALGTTLDVFTGATRLQSRLKKEGGRYKFVITMPSKGMCVCGAFGVTLVLIMVWVCLDAN